MNIKNDYSYLFDSLNSSSSGSGTTWFPAPRSPCSLTCGPHPSAAPTGCRPPLGGSIFGLGADADGENTCGQDAHQHAHGQNDGQDAFHFVHFVSSFLVLHGQINHF